MTEHQFHEGQEVEVKVDEPHSGWYWCKAKIVKDLGYSLVTDAYRFRVEFHNGTYDIFDAEHIRAVDPREEVSQRAPKTSEAEHRTMLSGDSSEVNPDYEHAPESKPGGGFL